MVVMEHSEVKKLVRQNDNEARRALFEAYYGRTFAVVYNILRRRENAEDITQDAFIKAFQSLDQLQDQSKFGAWLTVIASNLARNYLKREKKIILTEELPEISTGSTSGNTEEEALRGLEMERVRKAIRTLPPEHYQVVVLHYYHDLKIEEIASMLGIRAGTVKSRLFRAREKLAGELELEEGYNCHTNKGGGCD
ncbi:MAG: RNA polymerase sigma factor [Bacillota bacterium]